jgi:hypothetical protein
MNRFVLGLALVIELLHAGNAQHTVLLAAVDFILGDRVASLAITASEYGDDVLVVVVIPAGKVLISLVPS